MLCASCVLCAAPAAVRVALDAWQCDAAFWDYCSGFFGVFSPPCSPP